jgi:PhnB protein
VWDLVDGAFGAVELERHPMKPGAFHIEARIGDGAIVLELADPPHPGGKPAAVYVYMPGVDAAYAKAMALGAKSVSAPEDKPYDERAGGVSDAFGNVWYLSTYRPKNA